MADSHFIARTSCPACEGTEFRTIYKCAFLEDRIKNYLADFYSETGGVEFECLENATYELCECLRCALIFQKMVADDFLMERLYEHWIDPDRNFELHRKRDGLKLFAPLASDVAQMVAFIGKINSECRFLDFGMGWGNWARMAKAFGVQVAGCELSARRIEHARKSGIEVLSYDEIPGREFDLINTEQVFEHIPKPRETLRHLVRALAPGGIVKIYVPDAFGIKRRLRVADWSAQESSRNSLNPVAPLEHINCFSRKSIVALADSAGLREVFVPMKLQLQYQLNWRGFANVAKNFLRPIYRNVLKKQNCLFFRRM
ncbi:MAG: class I SAM-dependent methyltransferase [Planctomycetes bacterium]|nr:class I SAM-dependent methyltransferase [Planctomycetota bacterium]